jgi:trimeric autotransporter adhesin
MAVAVVTVVSQQAFAQPVIASLGVRNGASYALPGLPNSSIAQGWLFIVFGQNLGPAKIVQVAAYPLPTSQGLSGTSIQVTVNGTTVDAIMLYTLATQVAAVLPSTTPIGTGTIMVTYNGQSSAAAPITVVRSSFGIFAVNQSGTGPGVLQNVNSESDRPPNSPTQSAQPGQVIILWGTGLGPVTGIETGGPLPGDMPSLDVHVWVGAKEAAIQYRGRSGCCTGDDWERRCAMHRSQCMRHLPRPRSMPAASTSEL